MATVPNGIDSKKRSADDVAKENGLNSHFTSDDPQPKKFKLDESESNFQQDSSMTSNSPSEAQSIDESSISLPSHNESVPAFAEHPHPPESIPVSPVPTDSNPDHDQITEGHPMMEDTEMASKPAVSFSDNPPLPSAESNMSLASDVASSVGSSNAEPSLPKRERKMSHRYDDYEQPKMLGSLFSKQSNNSTQSDSKPQLTKEQHKFCAGIVKNMKRHKDAYPFLVPVDPVKLNIPDYPLVITQPMDLSTIEKKLQNNEYSNADAFTADFLLMFNNTRKYNGSESVFAKMAGNLEKSLLNQMKKLPSAVAPSSKASKAPKGASRRSSEEPGRPKREIHPPSREIPTITPPLRKKSGRATDDIKFCHTVLKEMMKKQHAAFNSVFLEPVPRATYPIYYDVVKKPMDLGTMKAKLEAGEYSTAHDFEVDMRQIFKNCYKFNPPGTDVYNMGKRLEALFNTKWAEKNKEIGNGKPRKREKTLDMSSSDVESSSDEEAASHIALMEKQLELMQAQLAQMKKEKKKKKKEKRERDISPAMMQPVARKSKPSAPKPPKVPKSSAPKKSKPAKRASEPPMYEEAEFTFEMKKELSESINTLPADRLTQVITIIQESMPELRDTNEEIELDISSLDSSTLWKLYRLVCNSAPAQSKSSRPATQKRKRMTDAEQSERLKMLEAQMAKFERGAGQQDSSSGSDSSDSDDSEDSVTEDVDVEHGSPEDQPQFHSTTQFDLPDSSDDEVVQNVARIQPRTTTTKSGITFGLDSDIQPLSTAISEPSATQQKSDSQTLPSATSQNAATAKSDIKVSNQDAWKAFLSSSTNTTTSTGTTESSNKTSQLENQQDSAGESVAFSKFKADAIVKQEKIRKLEEETKKMKEELEKEEEKKRLQKLEEERRKIEEESKRQAEREAAEKRKKEKEREDIERMEMMRQKGKQEREDILRHSFDPSSQRTVMITFETKLATEDSRPLKNRVYSYVHGLKKTLAGVQEDIGSASGVRC